MKLKLDENLPESLLPQLAALGHDVDNVRNEQLTGRSDPVVWSAAQNEKRFFITQDLDFSDVRRYVPGTHEGLLLIRLRAPGRSALASRVLAVFRNENVEDWKRCFVVMTDRKLRVHTPKPGSSS